MWTLLLQEWIFKRKVSTLVPIRMLSVVFSLQNTCHVEDSREALVSQFLELTPAAASLDSGSSESIRSEFRGSRKWIHWNTQFTQLCALKLSKPKKMLVCNRNSIFSVKFQRTSCVPHLNHECSLAAHACSFAAHACPFSYQIFFIFSDIRRIYEIYTQKVKHPLRI